MVMKKIGKTLVPICSSSSCAPADVSFSYPGRVRRIRALPRRIPSTTVPAQMLLPRLRPRTMRNPFPSPAVLQAIISQAAILRAPGPLAQLQDCRRWTVDPSQITMRPPLLSLWCPRTPLIRIGPASAKIATLEREGEPRLRETPPSTVCVLVRRTLFRWSGSRRGSSEAADLS